MIRLATFCAALVGVLTPSFLQSQVCLPDTIAVSVSGGSPAELVLDNQLLVEPATYALRNGVYTLTGIAAGNPITLYTDGLGHNLGHNIEMVANAASVDEGNGYFSGSVDVVVTGDFQAAGLTLLDGTALPQGVLLGYSFDCPQPSTASYAQCNDPSYADYHPYAATAEDCATGCTDPTACASTLLPFETAAGVYQEEVVCVNVDTVAVHTSGELAGYTTYRLYVALPAADDYLSSVYGDFQDALALQTTGDIYQSAAGGLMGAYNYPSAHTLGASDPLYYDSYVTIGYDPNSGEDPNALTWSAFDSAFNPWIDAFEGTAPGAGFSMEDDTVGGAWYVYGGLNPDGFPQASGDHAGEVLIAQITTNGTLSGMVTVQYFAGVGPDFDGTTSGETEKRYTALIGGCEEVYTGNCSYITAPTKAATVYLDADGNGTLDPADVYDAAQETCPPASLSILEATNFGCADLGEQQVTLVVTDAAGNTASGTATVTVADTLLPAFADIPVDITQTADSGLCSAVVSWTAPTASDNCGTPTVTSTHSSGDTFAVGETTVTYTATDAAGNETTTTFTVTVTDDEAPTFTIDMTPLVIPSDADLTVTAASLATVTDNCTGAGAPEVSLNGTDWAAEVTLTCDAVGEVVLYFRATDAAGNVGQATETLTVGDTDVDNDGVGHCSEVPGCTDHLACNYLPTATEDDATCEYFSCVCPDLNGDGMVTVQDLLNLLGDYGCTVDCVADFNGDGLTGSFDLLFLLADIGDPCLSGCMIATALNYDPDVNLHDGSCVFGETPVLLTLADGIAVEHLAFASYGLPEHDRLSLAIETPPSHGTAEISGGTITYTAGASYAGTDSFQYLLTDDVTSVLIDVQVSGALLSAPCVSPTMDGYTYSVVEIGDQCWFAENLRTTTYADGRAIPAGLPPDLYSSTDDWAGTHSGAMAVFGEGSISCSHYSPDIDACDEAQSSAEYGRLYNWYAVDNARGLCPSGWHVPTDGEWMVLEMELGMSESEANSTGWRGTDEGTQLKSTYGWTEQFGGGNGTDDFGFSAFPGGYRSESGYFYNAGNHGRWWSSSPNGGGAWFRYLSSSNPDLYRSSDDPQNGFSVRCLRDAEVDPIQGCTDPTYLEYDAAATVDDGSCATLVDLNCVSPSMDGYTYDVVQLGDQCWFAENLRTTTYLNGDVIPAGLTDGEWTSTTSGATAVYGEGSSDCNDYYPDFDACDEAESLAEYGRLYNWSAVDDARGLCPSGWHVPTDGEWTDLEDYITSQGFSGTEGQALKSTYGWYNGGNGTDDFGFSTLSGGYRLYSNGVFYNAGYYGRWWSSSPNGANAWTRSLRYDISAIFRGSGNPRDGFSVRCFRYASVSAIQGCTDPAYVEYDAAANTDDGSCSTLAGCTDPSFTEYDAAAIADDGSCATLIDPNCVDVAMDGHTYSVVQIGDQCWFAENLRTTTYADGTVIPAGLTDGEWTSTTTGATAVYGEGSSTCENYSPDIDACDETQALAEYGRLYNWYAVDDARGLCPSGWHVPTDGEWTDLENYISSQGFSGTEGTALKSTYGWAGGGNGTDDFGFSALPDGYRHNGGAYFNNAGLSGSWWSSSPSGGNAWSRALNYINPDVGRFDFYPRNGFSVRCLRDAD